MKYIDLFAGVGGFRYGIEMATSDSLYNKGGRPKKSDPETRLGFNCVYSNEWDKYANSVYRKHYGECDIRDIRRVKASEIPDHDLLCAGFPCQSFSIAGKRGGFEDTRGTLFFEISRIIKQKQPRLLLLENVKGLLSHDKGRTFATVITTLDELGYDCQWQVLNSKNFGVPQNRERVFIIGHLRGTSRPQVFPILGKCRAVADKGGSQIWDDRNKRLRDISPTLDLPEHNSIRILRPDKQSSQPKGDKSDSSNRIRRASYTDDMRIRRLTPIECERLQGFPDNWTQLGADSEPISDTQRYKMMGNAVTTNVVTSIVDRLV